MILRVCISNLHEVGQIFPEKAFFLEMEMMTRLKMAGYFFVSRLCAFLVPFVTFQVQFSSIFVTFRGQLSLKSYMSMAFSLRKCQIRPNSFLAPLPL